MPNLYYGVIEVSTMQVIEAMDPPRLGASMTH